MKVLILLVFFSSSVNASLDVLFFNEKMPKYKELNPITLESKDLLFKHPNDYEYQRIIVSNATVFAVLDDNIQYYYKRTNNPEKVIVLVLDEKGTQFIVIRKGEIKGKYYPRHRDLLTIDCMIDMKQDNLEGTDYVYGMCRKAKIEKKDQVSYTEIYNKHEGYKVVDRKYENGVIYDEHYLDEYAVRHCTTYGLLHKYKSGKSGEMKNGKKHGVWSEYYVNGSLKTKGTYQMGNKHGEWVECKKDGRISSVENYKHGKKNGIWRGYHANGKLMSVRSFQNGQMHGEYEYYYDNGQIETRGNYQNGQPIGKVTKYDRYGDRIN